MGSQELSFLAQALGDTPSVRVVDFLLKNKIYDFTKADIARGARVSRITLEKFWPPFERLGIVRETRRIGNGVLYSLNRGSPVVRKICELDWVLTKAGTERLLEKEAPSATAV